ncbi:Response regulator receiver modulated diguanylate cyclase [Candidatus Zixiibacteriota bacterium]|nr:Response regulator receiver modulated diguanylate cyclase [candidate division Zixibacteria bacterium]
MFHCACRQEGIDIIFHLSKSFLKDKISFHYFRTLDELLVLSQRYHLDLVIIAGKSEFMKEIEMVRLMKDHIFLSIIPTVLYHPEPSEAELIAGFDNGVDSFLHGEWKERLFEAELRMIAERSRRDISVNPSTWLPGPGLIEREIERLLKIGNDFGVCYADIDDFKAYNDYYGYYYGDRVIRLTARIIRDVVFDLCREGFVGHIGGDDFIFILPPDQVGLACENVIKTFDTLIQFRYSDEDRQRGIIHTRNRKGEMESFSFLTLSIAVLVNQKGNFEHVGEMSHMLADLKKYSKSLKGSNYVVERRKKY